MKVQVECTVCAGVGKGTAWLALVLLNVIEHYPKL